MGSGHGKNRPQVITAGVEYIAEVTVNSDANTPLIAAAPELFNLLSDIQDAFINAPCECDVDEVCLKHKYEHELESLIKKITGET